MSIEIINSEAITSVFLGVPNEILFKILDNLDDGSLLSCRRVNQDWCAASSTILQNRPTVFVRLSCASVLNQKDSLASFIECFKESQKFLHVFPCANYIVNLADADISECPEIQAFFALTTPSSDISGSALSIKCLRFDKIIPCQNTLNFLENLIFETTPQLKTLSLHFTPFRQNHMQSQSQGADLGIPSCADSSLTVPERKLLSLQVLQTWNCIETIHLELLRKILQSSPNIQRIESPKVSGSLKGRFYHVFKKGHLQSLIDTNKLHLVKQCRIFLHNDIVDSGLLDREKISGFQPTLLLLINPILNRFGYKHEYGKAAVREVLWTVKDSVEELECGQDLSLLDQLNVPRFSKLKRLNLINPDEGPIFPPGIRDWDAFFPSLEKICITRPRSKFGSRISLDCDSIPVIPSVRNLEIKPQGTLHDTHLKTMALICPNLHSLELSCFHMIKSIKFNRASRRIWRNITGLKTLNFYNVLCEGIESMDRFEAGFTGFSVKTIRQLRIAEPHNWPKVEEVEHLRVNPSILQMTELEKLLIIFLDKNQAPVSPVRIDCVCEKIEDQVGTDQVPVFPLSFKYAFDLMPRLAVHFSPNSKYVP